MTNIGKFRCNNLVDPLSELIGVIKTVGFFGRLAIVREGSGSNPNTPSHRIYLVADDVGRIEVGAAWSQTIKRGPREGEQFLSASIDDPSFAKPLSFAVFQEDEDSWTATWRRRKDAA